MARHRATADCGTPDFVRADLAGTAFLLAAEGRVKSGDGLVLARSFHRRRTIERARRAAIKPRALARNVLRATDRAYDVEGHAHDGDFRDPRAGAGHARLEAHDFLARLRAELTPLDARLMELRAEGVPFLEICIALETPLRTLELRWNNVRRQARALLGD